MLERSVERSLQEMADQEQPHPKVCIQQAIKQGSARLRRRRLMLGAGTPVLAACAALAISLAGVAPWSGHGSPPVRRLGAIAPGTFNPAELSVGFGWLPKGSLVLEAQTSPGSEGLYANGPHNRAFFLVAFARSACHLSRANGIERLGCSPAAQNPELDMGATDTVPLAPARPPAIDGHPSFWLEGTGNLAWERAPGEWAVASGWNTATTVRVAQAVKFGQQVPAKYGQRVPVRFGARFMSLPPGWRLVSVDIGRAVLHGVSGRDLYEADEFTIAKVRTITATTPIYTDAPMISFSADNSASDCGVPVLPNQRPLTSHVTIHGYHFTLTSSAAVNPPYQTLCGSPIDGLAVSITETGAHQEFPPTKVMDRLELLGPGPAHWVTNPLP